jgi:hypothetical protein
MKSGRTEVINSYIYDCDLEELYAILIKAEVLHSTDSLIYTLDLCDFVANNRKVEEKRRLLHQLRRVTVSQQPSLTVADLVQFDLSSNVGIVSVLCRISSTRTFIAA